MHKLDELSTPIDVDSNLIFNCVKLNNNKKYTERSSSTMVFSRVFLCGSPYGLHWCQ